MEVVFGIISEALQGKMPHSLIVRLHFFTLPFPEVVPSSITHFLNQTYLLMLFDCSKKEKKKIIPQNTSLPIKDNNEEASFQVDSFQGRL